MAERNDSATFLKTVKDVLGWEDLNTDTVMDIGCGNGRTAMTFLRTFPKVGKVLAIDIAAECLRIAERMHPDGKIEYQLADIRNRSTLDRWVGEMDKAVSVFCFHCLDDVRSGYDNMYRLLKPAGEAAILQSLRSGYYDFLNEIDNSPRWRDYFKDIRARMPMPVSYYENHSGDYYKKIETDLKECVTANHSFDHQHFLPYSRCQSLSFVRCPLPRVEI